MIRQLVNLNEMANKNSKIDGPVPVQFESFQAIGESYRAEFRPDLYALFDKSGFMFIMHDRRAFGEFHPFPIRSSRLPESKARVRFEKYMSATRLADKWQIGKFDFTLNVNGQERANGFGFTGTPLIGEVPVGPSPILEGIINADTGDLSSMRFRKKPTTVEKPTKPLISAERAEAIALGMAIRVPQMIQPEVTERPKLYVTADGLNVWSPHNHLNKANPKVAKFDGQSVGVYGYHVIVRSNLGLKESLKQKGIFELKYVIDAQDGSLLVGHGQK